MLRLNSFAVAALLGLLAACGSEGADGHGFPSLGESSGSGGTPANAAGGPGAVGTAGQGASSGGTSAMAQGGAPSTMGGAPSAMGGSNGNVAGANTGTAGTPPATGGAAPGPNDVYIATNGADTNPGTEAAPLATLTAALAKVKPGVTLWLKPGTYKYAATIELAFKYSGAAGKMVTLQAAPGGRPVLDFSAQPRGMDSERGLDIYANYWHIKGIELTKASDNCIGIAGSNNVIEDVVVHECGDTGIQITAPSSQATDDSRAANNTILNCDSWGNLDSTTGGENADGFAAKLRIGPGNVFKGCRAWNNADDGWDLFGGDDVVTIDNCWAFSNGKPIGGSNPQGDGNGFKLGGKPGGAGEGGAVHLVSNSFAFENKACGFTRNNNPDVPKLTNCGVKDNKDTFCNLSTSGQPAMSLSADAARTAARTADGSLPPMK